MWNGQQRNKHLKKERASHNSERSNIWIPCRPSAKGWESELQCLHQPSAWTLGSEATSFASALCHACGRCQPVANLTKQFSVKVDPTYFRTKYTHQHWENTCDCKVSVFPTKSSIFSPRSNICPEVQHSQRLISMAQTLEVELLVKFKYMELWLLIAPLHLLQNANYNEH